MRTAALVVAVVCSPILATAADKDAHFGSPGTVAPSGSVSLSNYSTGPASSTVLALAPSAYYFLLENLAVGLDLGLNWAKPSSGDSVVSFSLTPQAGYNVPLGGRLSIFPHAGVGYARSNLGGAGSSSMVSLTGFVPLLVHFGNFFLGVGPRLTMELWATSEMNGASHEPPKNTTIGLTTVVGGWL